MILSPLAALYGKAVSVRADWYASGRLSARTLPRPAISVGNLVPDVPLQLELPLDLGTHWVINV